MSNGKNTQDPKMWWDKLMPTQVGGDVIVANVSGGARNVAVGKNIQQNIDSTLGAMTLDDKQTIDKKFDELNATIKKMSGQIDATTTKMAEFQAKLLQGELSKTGENGMPSAATITQVGDWLLDNLPGAAETITSLFVSPAVGKVVGKAGEVAVKWAKQRFGGAVQGKANANV